MLQWSQLCFVISVVRICFRTIRQWWCKYKSAKVYIGMHSPVPETRRCSLRKQQKVNDVQYPIKKKKKKKKKAGASDGMSGPFCSHLAWEWPCLGWNYCTRTPGDTLRISVFQFGIKFYWLMLWGWIFVWGRMSVEKRMDSEEEIEMIAIYIME